MKHCLQAEQLTFCIKATACPNGLSITSSLPQMFMLLFSCLKNTRRSLFSVQRSVSVKGRKPLHFHQGWSFSSNAPKRSLPRNVLLLVRTIHSIALKITFLIWLCSSFLNQTSAHFERKNSQGERFQKQMWHCFLSIFLPSLKSRW